MALSTKAKGSMVALGAITLVALGSTSLVSAQGTGTGSTMVDKIASKFSLNKAEVQAVFDEERDARQAERFEKMSNNLQKAVDSGDITSEQKSLIENKFKELQSEHETRHDALVSWAEANNIDMRYIMMGGRHSDTNRLQDAVDNGDITTEQKALIEAKRAEIDDAREAQREVLETWAEANGIDTNYLRMAGHGDKGMRGGMRN